MSEKYFESKEVEAIAAELIPDMKWGDVPKIKFLVLDSPRSSYLGKCSKATGKWKHLTGVDYVIEVWAGFWKTSTQTQKQALLYHELLHVDFKEDEDTGEITWKLRKHEVEEFIDVVKKYGPWNDSLKYLHKYCEEFSEEKI